MAVIAGEYPSNIHIGMAKVFLNVTAPLTGDPPTKLTIDANGNPASGQEVGYTASPSVFTYKATKKEVIAEQSLNPVDVYIETEMCTLVFEAMERVFNTLKAAFDNIGNVQDASGLFFYGGDARGLQSVSTQTVCLTSRIRSAPTKFEVLTLYRVYNVEGIQLTYGRSAVSTYKVTLTALVDASRTEGDRLFQWYRQAPTGGFASASPSTSPSSSVSPSASASSSKSPSASVSPS